MVDCRILITDPNMFYFFIAPYKKLKISQQSTLQTLERPTNPIHSLKLTKEQTFPAIFLITLLIIFKEKRNEN